MAGHTFKIPFYLAPLALKFFKLHKRFISDMFYTYYLRSINFPEKTYIGFTKNLRDRLVAHNAGRSVYTKDDRPWKIEACFIFNTESKALRFEQYLKTNAGKVFLKRYVITE